MFVPLIVLMIVIFLLYVIAMKYVNIVVELRTELERRDEEILELKKKLDSSC